MRVLLRLKHAIVRPARQKKVTEIPDAEDLPPASDYSD
jgi:hypothetical protein